MVPALLFTVEMTPEVPWAPEPPNAAGQSPLDFCVHADGTVLTAKDEGQEKRFTPEAMQVLVEAPWPGNIRQLYNVVENAVALATSPLITEDLLVDALKQHQKKILPLAEARRQFEQQYLIQLLQTTRGNVSQAAKMANRNRTDFYKLLSRHHIVPALYKE